MENIQNNKNEELINFITEFLNSNKEVNSYAISFFNAKAIDNFASKILIKAHVGGASGGSCWDDDSQAQRYTKGGKEIIEEIAERIGDSSVSPIQEILKFYSVGMTDVIREEISEIADRAYGADSFSDKSESEYYGNYTDFELYGVNIEDVFKAFVPAKDFPIVKKVLDNFVEEEVILNNAKNVIARQNELERNIAVFEPNRLLQKQQYEKEIIRLQKIVENHDKETEKSLKLMKKELNEVLEKKENAENILNKQNKKPKPKMK